MGEVCSEVEDTGFSREIIATVTEAAFNQSQLLAWDIEAFAKSVNTPNHDPTSITLSSLRHAKRTVITPEDVRLCCRRNNDLLTHITEQIEKLKADRETRKAAVGERREEKAEGPKSRKPPKKRKIELELDDDSP